jgi:hypothetical protein
MLKAILSAFRQKETKTLNEIALSLRVSVPMLVQMLEQLARQGYLQELSSCEGNNTSDSCKGCTDKGRCKIMPVQKIWSLTEKGRGVVIQ